MPEGHPGLSTMEQPSAVLEQQEDQRNLRQQFLSSRVGQAVTGTVIALGIGGGLTASAKAEDGPIGPLQPFDGPSIEKASYATVQPYGESTLEHASANQTQITDSNSKTTIHVGKANIS